jgi:hypothetical protein
MSKILLILKVFNLFTRNVFKYILWTYDMIWNEYNEDKKFKKDLLKNYKDFYFWNLKKE